MSQSKCRDCGHDQYDGGSHECEKLNRTVYHYDHAHFETVSPPAPVEAPVEEPTPEVIEAAPEVVEAVEAPTE